VSVRIHPTAIVEEGVVLGDGTSVWDHAHIRARTRLGESCIVGGKAYIAYDNILGDFCKVGSFAVIHTGITLGDGVFVASGVAFTNEKTPRAATVDLGAAQPSAPTPSTLSTVVGDGTSFGVNAVVGPGLTIGRFAMIGMGSIVTHDIADFLLVTGQPARPVAAVCRCGDVLVRFQAGDPAHAPATAKEVRCAACALPYRVHGLVVVELEPPLRPTRGRIPQPDAKTARKA
jgi:UDP-2-acetamido-3-amino-2,3-dideoxy-glucuronate N-acetyltransferase